MRVRQPVDTCFTERDPTLALKRRACAEAMGTMMLMLVAAGASDLAQRLPPSDGVFAVVIIAGAISASLTGLIFAVGGISGGHLNPLVTMLQWLLRERSFACTIVYISAQCGGAFLGAQLASQLFATPRSIISAAVTLKASMSEVIASAFLMVVVFACARGGLKQIGPLAVGAWLFAAIIATPSTSYANPAIAFAAIWAFGPIALSAHQSLAYASSEIIGASIALAPLSFLFPRQLADS